MLEADPESDEKSDRPAMHRSGKTETYASLYGRWATVPAPRCLQRKVVQVDPLILQAAFITPW